MLKAHSPILTRRAASAAPRRAEHQKMWWQGENGEIEACGQLRRLILQYGKQFPHFVPGHACDKPETFCLHFCYCDALESPRPASGVFKTFGVTSRPASGASRPLSAVTNDPQLCDEMTMTFPKNGEINDYISELRLNTRRSTPLHWLEPEDKLAVHEITTSLQKAFRDASPTPDPIRSVSCMPKIEMEEGVKSTLTEEKEPINLNVPKNLIRPSTGRPMPRLAVDPCGRCARRRSLSAKRSNVNYESFSVANVVEACVGPSPLEPSRPMFYLNAQTSKDNAPPPSPTLMNKETVFFKKRIKKTSPLPEPTKRHVSYTGFIQSAVSDKLKKSKTTSTGTHNKQGETKLLQNSPRLSIDVPFEMETETDDYDDNYDDLNDEEAFALIKNSGLLNNRPTSSTSTRASALSATQIRELRKNAELSELKESSEYAFDRKPDTEEIADLNSVIVQRHTVEDGTDDRSGVDADTDILEDSNQTSAPRTVIILEPKPKTSELSTKEKKKVPRLAPQRIEKALAVPPTSKSDAERVKGNKSVDEGTKEVQAKQAPKQVASSTKPPEPKTSVPTTGLTTHKSSRPTTATTMPLNNQSTPPSAVMSSNSQRTRPSTVMPSNSRPTTAAAKQQRRPPFVGSESIATAVRTNNGNDSQGGIITVDGDSEDIDPGSVAKLKAQMTTNAQPIKQSAPVAKDTDNTGLVRPPSPKAENFKTLEDVGSSNSQNAEKQARRKSSAASSAKSERKVDDAALEEKRQLIRSMRPLPLPSKAKAKKKPESVNLENMEAMLAKKVPEKTETKADNVDETNAEAANVFVKSSERRPKKQRQQSTNARAPEERVLVMQPSDDGFEVVENDDGGGDFGADDEGDGYSLDLQDDIASEKVNSSRDDDRLSVFTTDESEADDAISEVDINERNESWWEWTSLAAQLMLEIERLRMRVRMKDQMVVADMSPKSKRRYKSGKKADKIRDETERMLTETVRQKLLEKEHSRMEFIKQLKVARTDIRYARLDMRKMQRSANKRVAVVRIELKGLRDREAQMAQRYYEKRGYDRAERAAAREVTASRMKVQLKSKLEQKGDEQEKILDALRDDAMFLLDNELRELEMTRIDDLEVEYREQRRIDLELKEVEIEKMLDDEEDGHQKFELVEEDILLGEIRGQITDLENQLTAEQGIIKANLVTAQTKIAALSAHENELIQSRVAAEKREAEELELLRDEIARTFQIEEDAAREQEQLRTNELKNRCKTAIALREQQLRLARDVEFSPAFAYSYFRYLEQKKKDDENNAKKKGPKGRRPNTAFK